MSAEDGRLGPARGVTWAWPTNARKVHLYVDGRVQCSGRWGWEPGTDLPDHDPLNRSRDLDDTCSACWGKFERIR